MTSSFLPAIPVEYEANDLSLINSALEENKSFLESLSNDIWSNPELKFNEHHAHAILTDGLQKYGFQVQKGYVLPTAFRAEFKTKSDTADMTTIAYLCEYDALPGIGHACGHNLIAQAGFAAAIALKKVLEANPKLAARIVVFGTPAEEGGGGKIHLIENKAFDNIDAALMVHPARVSSAFAPTLGIVRAEVTFKGVEAHAAAYPWEGKNALDAAVACYVSVGLLRQQVKPTCRVHGIITKGGSAPNIIPGETAMEFYIRAPSMRDLKDLKERVRQCFLSAASSAGCTAEYNFHDREVYSSVIHNRVLASLYQGYSQMLGVKYINKVLDGTEGTGSTDMGNVSRVVPSIHPFYAICDDAANHTKEFTKASGDPAAQHPTVVAATALALVGIRIIRSPEVRKSMRESFELEVANDS